MRQSKYPTSLVSRFKNCYPCNCVILFFLARIIANPAGRAGRDGAARPVSARSGASLSPPDFLLQPCILIPTYWIAQVTIATIDELTKDPELHGLTNGA